MKKYLVCGLALIFSYASLHPAIECNSKDEALLVYQELETQWLTLEKELETHLTQTFFDEPEVCYEAKLTEQQEALEIEIEELEALIAQFEEEERLAAEARLEAEREEERLAREAQLEAERTEQEAIARHLALPRRLLTRGKRSAHRKEPHQKTTRSRLDAHTKRGMPIIEQEVAPSNEQQTKEKAANKKRKTGAIPRYQNNVKARKAELKRREDLKKRSSR